MPSPLSNVWDNLEQFSAVLDLNDLVEGRYDNDVDGNPIYIGLCATPNGDPALPIWMIIKVEYVGTAIVRKRLPDEGTKFTYVWDDRADYFA